MGEISIGRAITACAQANPDRPAVTFYEHGVAEASITRGELDVRTNRLARAYEAMGVRQGDLVTIALPNGIEFYEAAVAVWKLGAIPQPVSYRLPDRERQAIVELADARLVVGAVPESHPGRTVLPAGFEPDAALDDGLLPDRISPSWKAPTSGGSTGRPKLILAGDPGVVDPEGQPQLFIQHDGTHVLPGPLYHNAPFGTSTTGLFHGNHVVVLPRFDPEATLAAVDRFHPDFLLLVPTMMLRIWRLPAEVRDRYDLSSLQTIWHMAAPCPAWLKEEWINWVGGHRLWELYAGTEAQAITVIRGDDWIHHRGSVGRVVTGEMEVVDPETRQVLSPGEMGEIYMRWAPGRRATYRYRGAEPNTLGDGWESLGDMGWLDEDGYLFLGDRRADMILTGGANVYPAEVEAALLEHPAVVSSAVIGLAHEDLGSAVHAVVQTAPVIDLDEADLRAFLAERVVRYKIPRTFELVDWPVRDDAGKVRRSALRSERGG